MEKLESIEQFEITLKENPRFFFLKHSLTCPISQAAFEEYESFAKQHEELNFYYLAVQEARPLSNHIAETFQVKHESPQALLFNQESVAWHASHWKITEDTLAKAVEE
ncbi:bacillithiol system redox-active protein YtxJ [Robertmurraya massiliosenegalensis]|uniref:bacillithiol system redox-active protein YtxJ n=1 Tax=Robertmurraya massiliosenegalensis TaxID=1287657 RepID=UPI0002EEC1B4|nr:bacillithiol system redox-active protein YtxJ [Robertmurraya massiliosenegalensis]